MKPLKFAYLIALFFTFSINVYAQSKITSYNLKKGEVFDILVLSTKPDTKALFEIYRKTAFPVAFKLSYTPLPGYKITENTMGNHEPQSFILGKWGSIEKREQFLAEIEKEVPDFHEQRRNLWSYFGLTYYEMSNDVSFEINRDKFTIVTAYWYKNKAEFLHFKKEWLQKLNKAGGEIIIELTEGKSPYGYYYNPDYMVIVQWEGKETFENFKKESIKINNHGLQHINQFVIK